MKYRMAILCLGGFLLASCGEQDVHSACFSNGDHENMSDGRIIRICDCIANAVAKEKPTDQENQWIVAWLNKRPMVTANAQENEQARKLAVSLTQLKARCVATK